MGLVDCAWLLLVVRAAWFVAVFNFGDHLELLVVVCSGDSRGDCGCGVGSNGGCRCGGVCCSGDCGRVGGCGCGSGCSGNVSVVAIGVGAACQVVVDCGDQREVSVAEVLMGEVQFGIGCFVACF